MPSSSDPAPILDALDRAGDAFEMAGRGQVTFEEGISAEADWKTQLTKACRLIEVAQTLQSSDGYYTAVIEVCFGTIERSIEAYALVMGGDDLRDFQDHEYAYDRAAYHGLFETETAIEMQAPYRENRTESYYGGGRPTEEQAAAMTDLAVAIHEFVVSQIREGGVCLCD